MVIIYTNTNHPFEYLKGSPLSNKKILVTGASSFIGAHACRILSQHHNTLGIWNSTPTNMPDILTEQADFTQIETANRFSDIDCIVHLAGKIKDSQSGTAQEINQKLMTTVLTIGKPIIYCSSTAVHWKRKVSYVESRIDDEQRLRDSGLPYVILRPCAPYGPPLQHHSPKHTESFQTLVNAVKTLPVIPLIGDGLYLRQPVHVEDFCNLMLYFLETGFANQELDVAGGKSYTFRDIIRILQISSNRLRPLVPIPKRLAMLGAKILPNLEPSLISVIDTDEYFDVHEIQRLVSLRTFEDGHTDLFC